MGFGFAKKEISVVLGFGLERRLFCEERALAEPVAPMRTLAVPVDPDTRMEFLNLTLN